MDKDNTDLVQIFTTPQCSFCRVLKGYLRSLNIEFREIDLSEDAEKVAWLIETTGQVGVPLTLFDNSKFVLGWQKDQIDIYLKEFKLIK